MKFLIATVILICMGFKGTAQSSGMSDSAYRIAKKLKDTLSLSDSKLNQIYNINMQLQLQKLVNQQQGVSVLQAIENTRDSLYHTILSDSLFILYKQKKQRLLSAN